MIRPAIMIAASKEADFITKEVLAGIEEEGVLYQLIHPPYTIDFVANGMEASKQSPLEIGIAIGGDQAAVFLQKLGDKALFSTKSQYRLLGQNAARYIKGNVLKGMKREEV